MRGFARVLGMVALAGAAALPFALGAQSLGDLRGEGEKAGAKGRVYLSYVAEPVKVAAGRREAVPVRLHVADGFHVNSHTPKSDLLIPTALLVRSDEPGVKMGEVEYPAGVRYSFASAPGEALDVYAGDVVVRVPVTATPGEHVLKGTVRYQACDDRSCFPPKSVPIEVLFTAR